MRDEYPRLLGTTEARRVAENTTDPTAFLASLHAEGKLNRDFKTGPGKIAYHMPCHLRAQRLGNKTGALLSLLPDTEVTVIQACSGHDGTWAMKRENFEAVHALGPGGVPGRRGGRTRRWPARTVRWPPSRSNRPPGSIR